MFNKTILDYIINYLRVYCSFEWGIRDVKEQTRIDITIQSLPTAPPITVLVHDPHQSHLDESHFAFVLAFDKDFGVEEGLLELWLGYVRQCVQHMLSTYHVQGVWSWQSDEKLFRTYVNTHKKLGRYKENILPYIIKK